MFWLFVALLVWAPIPLGSNRAWAWSGLEVAVFVLLAAWIVLWAFRGASAPAALRAAWPMLALLAVWLAYQALHIVPLPPSWIEFLSPQAARVQHLTDVLGITRESMTLSVDPHASRESLLKSLAYAGVFVLVLALVRTRERVHLLAGILVYAAVLHAIYAVLLHVSNVSEEHFGTLINHGPQASGTYKNRNHFAGYLEMMLALGIGLLISSLSDRGGGSWKRVLQNFLEWVLSPKMVLRLSLCILVIALTTTHSRMGNSAFFSSLLVAGLIGIALSRNATRNTVVLLVSLVVIDLFIVGSWFGVEKLAQRIQETTVEDVEVREDPAMHTIPLIKDYPVFGAGPGSFYSTFPQYRPETVRQFFDLAHNDYVQFVAESGLVGIVLLAAMVLVTLAAALRAHWLRHDPLMRGMSFACIMGVLSILIHSSVDFNLQIPANAVLFMVLMALGWVSLHLGRHHAGISQVDSPR